MSFKTLLRKMRRSRSFMIGMVGIVLIALACFLAPLYIVHDYTTADLRLRLCAPEWFASGWYGHILGTDAMGRDVLTRLLIGGRYSLITAAVVIAFGAVIGTALGMISGYFSGVADTLISRTGDVLMSMPLLLFAACIVAVLGASFFNLILVFAITSWVLAARLVRSSVLGVKNVDYVKAARVIGMRPARIMCTQILPNVLTPVIVQETQHLGGVILTEASLSFLGLGIPYPTPSWGNMIADGREYVASAPWTILAPGLALMFTVLSFNFLGDGIRDILDPKNID